MRDPILEELRRVRLRFLKEMQEDMHASAQKSNELLYKISDVVVSPTGERRFVLSAQKMAEVFGDPHKRTR